MNISLTSQDADLVLDPAPRGESKVHPKPYDTDGPGFYPAVAILEGWGGENILTIYEAGCQNGLLEFVVIEQRVDSPICWHRVASVERWNAPRTELFKKLVRMLNQLMDDGINPRYGDDLIKKARKKASARVSG